MENLSKNEALIRFDVKRINEMFKPEFRHLTILSKRKEHSAFQEFSLATNIYTVKEFIESTEDNNWCEDDREEFDQEMKTTNPSYQHLITLLEGRGYLNLNDITKGTLWVVRQIMLKKDLVVIGPVDEYGKVAKNSWTDYLNQLEYASDRKERRITKRLNDGDPVTERRGPKKNVRHTIHQDWLRRLMPWFKTLPSVKNEKAAHVLVGLLLHHAGFNEFEGQYNEIPPTKKHVTKSGETVYNPIPFTEYLYNRMKTIYKSIC
ncbi:MAG: hypothetical protein JNL40_07465 [Cyclobacteriaceae bacterium]|nr:hypothetical protein [Cyclobacteriaceae bacterium]